MSLKNFQGNKISLNDYVDNSSCKMSENPLYHIKQSAYFHHEKKLDPTELKFAAYDERLLQLENQYDRRFEHLEDRVKQVNQKFERIEQLGEVDLKYISINQRLESLNKLIDTLKTNFDAKLMVYEDKIALAQQKLDKKITLTRSELMERLRNEPSSSSECSRGKVREGSYQEDISNEVQQLYQMMKKVIAVQREIQMDVQGLKSNASMTKERDIRQSDVLLSNVIQQQSFFYYQCTGTTGVLKQSGVLNSGSTHQRVDSFKQYNILLSQPASAKNDKNDRIRSITLEKEKQLKQQENIKLDITNNIIRQYKKDNLITEEDELDKKPRSKSRKVTLIEDVDKYQFTLQSKALQSIDSNVGRLNPTESVGQIVQAPNSAAYKSRSQQGQLRMTFNYKEEMGITKDKSQLNIKQSMVSIPTFNKQYSEQQQDSGKQKNQLEKQNLLERAVSQESLQSKLINNQLSSRSKYLSSDKMGKIFKQDEENQREHFKNTRK